MKLSELLADTDRLVNRYTVPVLLSTDAAIRCARANDELEAARRKLAAAQKGEEGRMSRPDTDAAQQAVDEAQAEVEAANEAAVPHLVDFVVESVGSDEWEALIDAHPPTEAQREQFGSDVDFDPRAFPLVAITACLVDPVPPPEELAAYLKQVQGGVKPDEARTELKTTLELKASIPDVVWQQLFAAVLRVNRGANAVPKSLTGSAATTGSERGSGQPST